jgi:CRP/FNR family transcriptional regulator
VCGAVARPELHRLAALATIANASRGQTFLHEGAPAEHFCVLIQGSAKLYKLLPDGRRQIVGFGYAGSFLGVSAPETYAFSAEAMELVRMCRLSRRGLLRLLGDSEAMRQRLLEVAVNKLVQAQDHMVLLGRKTSIERMASFLMFQAKRPQPRSVLPPRIHLPMSRGDIADYLGVTVETVCRSLARFAKCDVIAIPNVHEVVILDLSRLESLANGASLERVHIPPSAYMTSSARTFTPAMVKHPTFQLASADARR